MPKSVTLTLTLLFSIIAAAQDDTYRVLRATDGDTIEIDNEGQPEKVRHTYWSRHTTDCRPLPPGVHPVHVT